MQPFKPGSGKSAAYAVWVDIRGENIVEMREKLVAGVQKFHSIGALPQPQRQLSAPAELPANEEVQMEEDEDFISEAEQARAMTSEFFPDENVDSGDFGSAIASVPEVSEPKTIEPAKPENLDAEPAAEPTATANDPGPLVSKDEAKLIVITARKKASPPLEAETLTKYLSDKHGIAGGVTYVPKSKVDEICKALRGE